MGAYSGGDSNKFVGFSYGTSSWGKTSDVATEWSLFNLSVSDSTFKASVTLDGTVYYLTVPTSNGWSLATDANASNSDLIIGTSAGVNAGEDAAYAVANADNLARHIRLNGTSGFRSYATTTGNIAYFYKVPKVEIPDDSVLTSVKLEVGEGATSFFQYSDFIADGYLVTAIYTDGESNTYEKALALDNEGLTWNLDTKTLGTTELSVTYNDGKNSPVESNPIEVEIVEIPASTTYQLSEIPGFDDWDNGYKDEHSVEYTDFSLTFSAASHQSQTITDIPVSKINTTTLLSKGKTIVGIEFGFRQWNSKGQSITLSVGENLDDLNQVESLDFPSEGTRISYVSETGFKAVKVATANDAQIGWEYITIEFAGESESQANTYAGKFLDVISCNDTSVTAEKGAWDQMASEYETLTDSDKEIFQKATANPNSDNIVEQAVARYDRIVGKYGTAKYQDFMGRNPANIAGALTVNSSISSDVWVVAGISLVAILAAAALFFLRKKKEA